MFRPYTIDQGKIQNSYCEINVAEHCNLSCRSCSHLSPITPKRFVEPDGVFRDLSTLAESYHVRQVKLLGGEPLLHPALLDIVDAVKLAKVADGVCVVTNGTRLPAMPRDFWERVDDVWVSAYPGYELDQEQVRHCQSMAAENQTRLWIHPYPNFRESHAALGTADADLVARIYATCDVAHTWRCHVVADGYFYRCPQSYFLPRGLGPAPGTTPEADGVRISSGPDFQRQLLAYLQSPEPLISCQRCLGTVGKLFPHQQLGRRDWSAQQEYATEELLDHSLLAAAEGAPRA